MKFIRTFVFALWVFGLLAGIASLAFPFYAGGVFGWFSSHSLLGYAFLAMSAVFNFLDYLLTPRPPSPFAPGIHMNGCPDLKGAKR